MGAIPILWSWFMGPSLVFMIVYVWSRELPNTRVNIQGLVELKVSRFFYFHITIYDDDDKN